MTGAAGPPPWDRPATVAALRAAGCVAAEEEAEELWRAGRTPAAVVALVARRAEGEPLAWLTGTARFCGLDVIVRPGVYVPRWQSECLAERAAAVLPARGRAVDVCTGSGAVALVLATRRPRATVLASDVDEGAVACARANGVEAHRGALFDGVPAGHRGLLDVVTAVPPYVPAGSLGLLPRDVVRFEPRRALDGGPDGLDLVRRLAADATGWLRPGGWLAVEVGSDQVAAAAGLLARAGYAGAEVLRDGDGDGRGVLARWPGGAA